jgi:hypothetical protein
MRTSTNPAASKIKSAVLRRVAGKRAIVKRPYHSYDIGGTRVHVRFSSQRPSAPVTFGFNLNRASLSADFDLWICGSPAIFYLVPRDQIEEMYEHPDAYVDKWHHGIRSVSVHTDVDEVSFARVGRKLDLKRFRNRAINGSRIKD